ncbi:hypothetical protein ABIC01_008019 [Bradyrhizobium sp. RT4b]
MPESRAWERPLRNRLPQHCASEGHRLPGGRGPRWEGLAAPRLRPRQPSWDDGPAKESRLRRDPPLFDTLSVKRCDATQSTPSITLLRCMGHRVADLAAYDHNRARILLVGSPEELTFVILLGGSPQRRRPSFEHADPESFISISPPTRRSKAIRARQRATGNKNGYHAAVSSLDRGSVRRARRARGVRRSVFATWLEPTRRSDGSKWRGQIHSFARYRRFLAIGIWSHVTGGVRSHGFSALGRAPPLRGSSRRAEISVDRPRKPRDRPGNFGPRSANPVRRTGASGVSPRSRSARWLSLRGAASPCRIGPAPGCRSPSMAARRAANGARPARTSLAQDYCRGPSRKRRIDARRHPRTTRSAGDNPSQARSEVSVFPLRGGRHPYSRLSQGRERRGHAAFPIFPERSRRNGDAGWGS